jgi:hypothetical protein
MLETVLEFPPPSLDLQTERVIRGQTWTDPNYFRGLWFFTTVDPAAAEIFGVCPRITQRSNRDSASRSANGVISTRKAIPAAHIGEELGGGS